MDKSRFGILQKENL